MGAENTVKSWDYIVGNTQHRINDILYNIIDTQSLEYNLMFSKEIHEKYGYTIDKHIIDDCNIVLKYLQERAIVSIVSRLDSKSSDVHIIYHLNEEYNCVTAITISIPVKRTEVETLDNFYEKLYSAILLSPTGIHSYYYVTNATPRGSSIINFSLLDENTGLLIDDRFILGMFNYSCSAKVIPSEINEMHLLTLKSVKDFI